MMARSPLTVRFFLGVLLVLSLIPLQATQDSRSLHGVVIGRDGKSVDGAVVKLKNIVTLQIRSFITKGDGSYRFYGLNPDIEYEVWATYRDAASDTKTLSKFNSEKEPVINLALK